MSSERPEILVGFHPLRERFRSAPETVETLLIGRGRAGRRRQELEQFARRHSVGVREVDERELSELAQGAGHNGFAAVLVASPNESGVPAAAGAGDPLVVLLEDVQDPRNLGAILRVCDATAVQEVVVRDRGSAPLGPAAVKASAGASSWVPTRRFVNTAQEIQRFQEQGFWVYGADAGGQPVWQVDLTGPVVLCMGGEEKGLRQRTRSLCDGLLSLPMLGRVDSLNVASATAVLLYEVLRQRGAS